jgi:CzcA family heavy metal efflux pump
MFNHLIAWSIKNRSVVIFLACLLMIFGIYTAGKTDVDVLPEFAPPQVVINVEAPGLVPEQVEALVSMPIELALNGTPELDYVKSVSSFGLSNILAVFNYGVDIYKARQLVNEKLQLASAQMPGNVQQPVMLPTVPAVGDIIKLALVADKTSPLELRTIADWNIRNRLLAIPGIARVTVIGGEEKEFQVFVNPGKLKSYNLTLQEVSDAVKGSNSVAPAGVLRTSDTQYVIRFIGRVRSLDDLENSVVAVRGTTPILLSHIARIVTGAAYKVGDAVIDGRYGVFLNITKQPGASTVEVSKAVEQAVSELKKGLPSDIQVIYVFKQADFIERSVNNVIFAIGAGGFLVLMVIIVFLWNWRASIVSLTAIPLSILAAILVVKYTGGTINTMTLGGLAIAVGEVVDDAIVDVENVFRRLRENYLLPKPLPVYQVIFDASREVRGSVVYATFIVALVFLPIFTMTGVEGRIFSPLGVSYIVAILTSLFVALTVTPAMCMYFLHRQKDIPRMESWTVKQAKAGYEKVLSRVLTKPKMTLVTCLALFFCSLALLPFMGQAFLPPFSEDSLVIPTVGRAGQSLEATTRMGVAFEKKLLNYKEVLSVGQWAGRADADDMGAGPNYSEFDVRLKPDEHSLNHMIADIRQDLSEIPGMLFDIGSFISHRMDEVLSGGTRAEIAIKIFGPDLPTLTALGNQVADVLKGVPGSVDVRTELPVPMPELAVTLDRVKASRYGLTSVALVEAVEVAFQGKIVSKVLDDQRLYGLKVAIDEPYRHNVELIQNTTIDTPNGMRVPLEQLATIKPIQGPSSITRENVSRRVVVQANTSGRDVVGVVNQAKGLIEKKVTLPSGYYIVYAGEYAAQQQAAHNLLWMSIFAFIGIMILLNQGLGSWTMAVLVAANLPLAMIGGIIAVALTGNVISIGSLIGFISLFGISSRNSILLVTHINHLIEEGKPLKEALFLGCLDRVTPVLMTASTAALGMLPLAIMGGPGRELEQPLAAVVIGGLASSTLLTLIVIPTLYQLFLIPKAGQKVVREEIELG